MSKRFILLMLSVGACLGCGAPDAEPTGAEPTEKVTSDIVWSANGHDYDFVQTPQTWSAARGKCINYMGGHLATIGDSTENEFIRAMANQYPGGAWWLGRNDIAAETFWKWENNEALRYDNWFPGEPNNYNNEDCAEIDPFSGQWNDLDCNTLLPFVCERDSGAAQPYTTMTYSASDTNSATQNYVVLSFNAYATTVVTLGTCGVPGASNTGDTFLRVFDPSNSVEIVSNDDACGGAGSNISFIPSVSDAHIIIHAGCWGAGSCSGTIAVRSPG
jgi:hypothetical protein